MLRGARKIRLIIGAGLVLFAVLKYCSSAEINPYTNEKQHIGLSETEEIAMGLNAAPQMAHQDGGLHPDTQYQDAVDRVGKKLVNNSIAKDSNYKFDFHLLADERTIMPLHFQVVKFLLPTHYFQNSKILINWQVFLDMKLDMYWGDTLQNVLPKMDLRKVF